ncbi:hypothetical protein MTBLM1_20346 [Rhodospirillaceae bacterium LM-1]|nr:hypothetical protein MTBLM1_20346 [Rhodospirillaceae bacterium LM-1]
MQFLYGYSALGAELISAKESVDNGIAAHLG